MPSRELNAISPPDPSLRRWRAIFILYAMAITAGTHWPKLRIETEIPGTDKIIHFLGFGAMAWLLWKTRWLPWLWLTGLLVAYWIIADELSQGIPGLGRTVSGVDIIAGLAGGSVIILALWFCMPVGDLGERIRHECARCTIRRARKVSPLRRGMNLRTAQWVLFMAVLSVPIWVLKFWMIRKLESIAPTAAPIVGSSEGHSLLGALRFRLIMQTAIVTGVLMAVGFIHGRFASRRWLLIRTGDSLIRECPCYACGASCIAVGFDEHGWSVCPACARPVHAGQWITPPVIHAKRRRRLHMPNRWVFVSVTLALFLAMMIAVKLSEPEWEWLWGSLMVMSSIALAVWFFRTWRTQVAKVFDRQHIECRECGYDLRATPVERGLGTCPECGTPFARMLAEEMPAVNAAAAGD